MTGDLLLMNSKERERKAILSGVQAGQLSLKEAAKRLGLSYRQIKRVYKRYRKEGDAGLVHGHRGRASQRAYAVSIKAEVLGRYQRDYQAFGPTLFAEKLAEEGYTVHAETLRLWLKKAGLWQGRRQRKAYRQRRARRDCFGELVQLDGSHHAWFGEAYPRACLMNMVDDATGETLALLAEQETTEAAFELLAQWIQRYGLPKALYVDLKSLYVSPKALKQDEADTEVVHTHFSLACERLGIEIIKAYSPQAKGRVERKHAVFQDRFVKELALQKITGIEKANELLEQGFLQGLNKRFTKAPANSLDVHRSATLYSDLEQILCWQYERRITNDWTVQFEGKYYQLAKKQPIAIKPTYKVNIRRHRNQTLSFWYQGQPLAYQLLTEKPAPSIKIRKGHCSLQAQQKGLKGKANSPWKQFNPGWLSS